MGDEHGERILVPRYFCEESSAAVGADFGGRPPRADERNADGFAATFLQQGSDRRNFLHSVLYVEFAS
jgi:hypothetical protein